MPHVMQCLSVRPSVTFVDSLETNKHTFKIFNRELTTSFQFFYTKVRTTTAMVDCAVYRADLRASVNLVHHGLPAEWTTTTKRRERNRIYLYTAVNLKRK